MCRFQAHGLPAGGVVQSGTANITTSGSVMNIAQTSGTTLINWTGFNIGQNETVNFNQPAYNSVAWNFISDSAASIISGNLNANGVVILQNPNGFTVSGTASINAHGLIMTTAPTPPTTVSANGPWTFSAMPPSAQIINLGQINAPTFVNGNGAVIGGGVFLIASDIVNNGTITAPNGKIGLYDGEQVLVSQSGILKSLSAQVTLPQGSVDNEGNLIANAGTIAAQAQFVNQNGFVQANAAQNVNGTIQLVASDTLALGPGSTTSAEGSSLSSGGGVTLQAGNVINNGGSVTADASSISVTAPIVNQNGTLQANVLGSVNGSIGINAGDTLTLGTGSTTSAEGSSQSSGGGVSLQAVNVINNNGSVVADGSSITVTAPTVNQGGTLQANALGSVPGTIGLNAGTVLNFLPGSDVIGDNLNLALSSIDSSGNINLAASGNIVVNSAFNLPDSTTTSLGLYLSAGNDITLNGNILAGQNWSVNLNAGTSFFGTAPTSGNDGIYLNGSASIQAENGNINLYAANEVILGSGGIRTIGVSTAGGPATGGGNISVTALYGDVNTGTGIYGLNFHWDGTGTAANPYYTPFTLQGAGNTTESIEFDQSRLTGIGTAAGGNITINAGLDVISFPTSMVPTQSAGNTVYDGDPGAGAFGSEAGNVTISAGRNVSGNFMEINGTGTINAGGSIGYIDPNGVDDYVSLSLASGSWTLNAKGNIYLTEVLNPNGVFNDTTSETASSHHSTTAGNHLFDYSPQASVELTAGDGVYLTGNEVARPDGAVPIILPPIVTINAGAGGVNLYTPTATDGEGNDPGILSNDTVPDIAMFPSPYGNLEITTLDGGSLNGENGDGHISLMMSDSAQTQWSIANSGIQPFSEGDDAAIPAELNNPEPVTLNISGSMNNVTLDVCKSADIYVAGDMESCSFFGENLQPDETTSLTVGGQIFNPVSFNSVTLNQSISTLPLDDLSPTTANEWFTPLDLAVNATELTAYYANGNNFFGETTQDILSTLQKNFLMFPALNNNLAYDPATQTLTAAGPLSSSLVADLEETLTVPRYANGQILVYPAGSKNAQGVSIAGQLETDTITLTSPADALQLQSLVNASQNAPPLGVNNGAYIVGGTGQFNVTAGSISLGNSYGILTVGNGNIAAKSYSFLPASVASGATITVTAGSLEMPASTIAALSGGNVNVNITGDIPNDGNVSMDLGSQSLSSFEGEIMAKSGLGLGVYTSGGGSVTVNSYGTVDVDSSRIATFNGGDVNITSSTGDVDAGSGGLIAIPVNAFSPTYYYYITGKDDFEPVEYAYANGIVTENLIDSSGFPGIAVNPGSITIYTPEGDIDADLGGILQESLNGSLNPGPFIDLTAGSPGHEGNINLGQSGVIGGSINATANGNITGLLISQQNANVQAAQSFSGTILSGGTATIGAGGSVSGTIIGASGVNASGAGGVSASLLGQNVSVNGSASQSTLGANATASATSQAAAQQSTQTATQRVASDTDENDEKKKKKKPTIHVGRVTVILSAAVPPR